ncbi:MAG TPA: isocitrate lyase/phosphoenolpyruvate mutase family protein [Microthrixaceae bacterium]|nr:isocitrate lyase/phosphoenolpyruvate mutase family protein [Microthrixaceae bacterium]
MASEPNSVEAQRDRIDRFRELHDVAVQEGRPLVIPNPWDQGSARLLASLGAHALATTSSGHAATLGRLDGSVTRDEAIAHSAAIVAAVDVPVSADLEDCFGQSAEEVADTVHLAAETGLAGCSIEDANRKFDEPIYELGRAVERVAAAAEAAHGGEVSLVLTARAEGALYGRDGLEDIVTRLRAFAEAGADVVFAPGVQDAESIRRIVSEVGVPVSVLALAGTPTVAELGELGVARVSVGGSLSYVGLAAVAAAARELLDDGTYGYWEIVAPARQLIRDALAEPQP